jgi:predicted phage baseplate assembly protein
LNRVPDRNYIKFLELIGVRLFPPTAATVQVTYWLAATQPDTIAVPRGSEVATPRTEAAGSAIVFTTTEQLSIVPCEMEFICSQLSGGNWQNHTEQSKLSSFACFSPHPEPGDALLIGLSEAVPRCAVNLRFDCEIEGVGVDPEWPPLVWEAYDGRSWHICDVDKDTTGGLNRAGDVVVHVPPSHSAALDHRLRAGWLRARVVQPEEGQPFYSDSPVINSLEAFTVGGTIGAVQAEIVEEEMLGTSEGVPGQGFLIARAPLVHSVEPMVLEVQGEDDEGWQEWSEVEDFSQSGAEDQHFRVDQVANEIALGPAVRNRDGGLVHYGAVPGKGAFLRLRQYHTGGGHQGNVSRGAIRVSRTSIPFVSRVENRRPAFGGVDGEDIEEAKVRGPILLRTLGRAVTAEDYELLAREAAPEAARVRAVPADGAEDAGGVRVLLVPAIADNDQGRLEFEHLQPSDELLSSVASYLDARRTIGARVMVEPPHYQGVTVVAQLRARSWADAGRLQTSAIDALYAYLHPISGGPEGTGWPFGRPVHMGEVYALLQQLPGTELVEDVHLFAANPVTGEMGQRSQRVAVASNALVFSYEHQIRVEET